MEASSFLSLSPKSHFLCKLCNSIPSSLSNRKPFYSLSQNVRLKSPIALTFPLTAKNSLISSPCVVTEALETTAEPSTLPKGAFSKIDNNGRFCSPRAARELALLVAYAACMEGSDPVCLFDKRVHTKRVPGYVFDKASLLKYDHMSFGGEPVMVESQEEADELMQKNERDSAIDADVLSAPPKLVYNKFVLRLARDLLAAVVNQWNENALAINKIIPQHWKNEPAARILELCILHLAMAEITALRTRHQIVINEAVDLAKRFCDGQAPRIINGCLRTFIVDRSRMGSA